MKIKYIVAFFLLFLLGALRVSAQTDSVLLYKNDELGVKVYNILCQGVYYKMAVFNPEAPPLKTKQKSRLAVAQVSGGDFAPGNGLTSYGMTYGDIGLFQSMGSSGPTDFQTRSYTYQWYKSTDRSNWQIIPGATSHTYLNTDTLKTTTYFTRATTYQGVTRLSGFTPIRIKDSVNDFTAAPSFNGDSIVCLFRLPADSYQWYASDDNSHWHAVPGRTTNVYNYHDSTQVRYLMVEIHYQGKIIYSNSVCAFPALKAGDISFDGFNGLVKGGPITGADNVYAISWNSSSPVHAIVTDSTYKPDSFATVTSFVRAVSSSSTQTSDYKVLAYTGLNARISPGNYTVPVNQSVSSGFDCQFDGSCTKTLSLQWQFSDNNSEFEDLPGETNAHLNISDPFSSTDTFYYRCRVVCGTDTSYSQSSSVAVYNSFVTGTIDSSVQYVRPNVIPRPINAPAASSTTCSTNMAYQWERSIDGVNFTPANGSTGQNISFSAPISLTTYYRRKATCNSDSGYSNVVALVLDTTFHPVVAFPTSIDSVLMAAHVNLDSTLGMLPDSVANARGSVDSALIRQNMQLHDLQSVMSATNQTVDSSIVKSIQLTPPIDTVGNLLGQLNPMSTRADSIITTPVILTDSIVQASIASGNYASLDSLVNSSRNIPLEEVLSRVRDSVNNLTDSSVYTKQVLLTALDKFYGIRSGSILDGVTAQLDSTLTFTATFKFPFQVTPYVRWVVNGGVIVSQNTNPANGTISLKVKFNSTFSSPYIAVVDVISGQYQIQPISVVPKTSSIGGFPNLNCIILPATQVVYNGTAPTTLDVLACYCTDPGVVTASMQWQQLDVYNSNTWTDIAGANALRYKPGVLTSPWMMYRRVAKGFNSNGDIIQTVYSSIANVQLASLDGGRITAVSGTNIPLNTVPDIAATDSYGGALSQYSYSWQTSLDGTTWQSIGTGANFPSFALTNNNIRIRRMTSISGNSPNPLYPPKYLVAYSNELIFTTYYQSVDYENLNYLREHNVLTRGVTTWEQADALPNGLQKQITSYVDGLGRHIQTVEKAKHYDGTSGSWQDIVKPAYYLAGGTMDKDLLPYPSIERPGKFKINALSDQSSYYQANYGDNNAFQKFEFDNTPGAKVIKRYAPGNSWGGAGKGATGDIDAYLQTESVRIWKLDPPTGTLPVSNGVYADNALLKSQLTNEDGKLNITYFNKFGFPVLKREQTTAGAALTADIGWNYTYYVYDQLNQLRYTITPKAVEYLRGNNWVLTQAISDELCFTSDYDEYGRIATKKTPGKSLEYFIYDNRGRVIMTQNGNQRAKATPEWTVTMYDGLDREVATGTYRTALSQTQIQTAVQDITGDQIITFPSFKKAGSGTVIGSFTLSVSEYPLGTINLTDRSVFLPLEYKFYDDYSSSGVNAFQNSVSLPYKGGDVTPFTQTTRTLGMPTQVIARVLNTDESKNEFLGHSIYYNEEGQAIQSVSDNIKGGLDVYSEQYHFDGRSIGKSETHTVPSSLYSAIPIVTKNIYDVNGSLVGTAKKINSTSTSYSSSPVIQGAQEDKDASYKQIASYSYDAFERPLSRTLSPGWNNGSGLESLSYSYNVRGWLTGINKAYALGDQSTVDQWSHYFGIYLGYDNSDGIFSKGQFTGKLTGIQWKSQGDNVQRKYDFGYDFADRLTKADFTQKGSAGESWNNTKYDFSVKDVSYDANGNLLTMTHMGVLAGAASPVSIDKLTYNYAANSNRLTRIDDTGNAGSFNGTMGDFKDGGNASGTDDYSYDANGNIINDLNRGIKGQSTDPGIVLNYLDQAQHINVQNKGTIDYLYDAAGVKLQKLVTDNSSSTGTVVSEIDYLGSMTFKQTNSGSTIGTLELESISHEEGRIRVITPYENPNDPGNVITGGIALPNGKEGVYDYFIKDNLGNVRVTLTEEINKGASVCTMEDADNTIKQYEEALFGNTTNNEVAATRVNRPVDWTSGTPAGQLPADNKRVSKLQASGNVPQVGPNVLLKVMAGDIVRAKADYYYLQDPGSSSQNTGLNALVQSLIMSLTGGKGGDILKGQASSIGNSLSASAPVQDFFNTDNPTNVNAPKAYLNWVFFDEQMNFVGQSSGFAKVSQPGNNAAPLVMADTKAPKNGYAYVYLSNESGEPVYFDNFAVSHEKGRLIQEDHYYSYGLRIAGISSRAIQTTLPSKDAISYGYQGEYSEELTDFELNYNEFELRTYDPQIGRWTAPDPYDEFASPFAGMGNDPANNVDPTGGFIGGPGIRAILAQVACPGGSLGFIGDFLNSTLGSVITMTGSTITVFGTTVVSNSKLLKEVTDILRELPTTPELSRTFVDADGELGGDVLRQISPTILGTQALKAASLTIVLTLTPIQSGDPSYSVALKRATYEYLKELERFNTIGGTSIPVLSLGWPQVTHKALPAPKQGPTPWDKTDFPPAITKGKAKWTFIYETISSDNKGTPRAYFGITSTSGVNTGGKKGRYPQKSVRGGNMRILGIAPEKIANGVEQALIELNNDGAPNPVNSLRIDNINNSLDPVRDNFRYLMYKYLGEQWLNMFYPNWRKPGASQTNQFLRQIIP